MTTEFFMALLGMLMLFPFAFGVVIAGLFGDDDAKEQAAALAYNPPKQSSGKGPTKRAMIANAAIPQLLSGKPFSLQEAADLVGDASINNVSTLLGAGCGGKSDGPRLSIWDNQIDPNQFNIRKLLECLSEAEQQEVVDGLGGKEVFAQEFEKLRRK